MILVRRDRFAFYFSYDIYRVNIGIDFAVEYEAMDGRVRRRRIVH